MSRFVPSGWHFRKLSMLILLAAWHVSAQAVDWSGVTAKSIPLFYPGQTGMEWIRDKHTHDGAARYEKRGKPCRECHEGEEIKFGPRIASGQFWETTPLAGRRGFVNANVMAAADATNLYVRIEWQDDNSVAGSKLDKDFQTKINLMIGEATMADFKQGGCWILCHQDGRKMPAAKGDGVMKYLAESRAAMDDAAGGGENYKPDAELDALLTGGTYLQYLQAKLNPGAAPVVVEGYVLKERTELTGSALSATAELTQGTWRVEFTRPLAGSMKGQKTIDPTKLYSFGIGLHDQNTAGRYHLVSLEYTMSQSPGGDLVIKKL